MSHSFIWSLSVFAGLVSTMCIVQIPASRIVLRAGWRTLDSINMIKKKSSPVVSRWSVLDVFLEVLVLHAAVHTLGLAVLAPGDVRGGGGG